METNKPPALSRRQWLQRSMGILTAGAALSACKDNDGDKGIDLGSGDSGLVNLLLALEQLQAAFFALAAARPYTDISATEAAWLDDIRQHDSAHRELLRILAGGAALPALQFSLGYLDFTKRSSVLTTAKTLKDLCSSAYLSAMQRMKGAETLALLSKMASVEARHAAWISNLVATNNFAGTDVVDSHGFERVRTPNQILAVASGYIVNELNGNKLPA